MIAKVRYPHPGVHGQGIAGSRQAVLAKDLIRKSLAAFKFVGIITGDTELYFNRLFVLPEYSRRK